MKKHNSITVVVILRVNRFSSDLGHRHMIDDVNPALEERAG